MVDSLVCFVNQPAQIAGCRTVVLATPPGSGWQHLQGTYVFFFLLHLICYTPTKRVLNEMVFCRRYCIVPRRLVSLTSLKLVELRLENKLVIISLVHLAQLSILFSCSYWSYELLISRPYLQWPGEQNRALRYLFLTILSLNC